MLLFAFHDPRLLSISPVSLDSKFSSTGGLEDKYLQPPALPLTPHRWYRRNMFQYPL